MSGPPEEELRRLREELRAYGRSLDAPDGAAGAETMAERVVARILAERAPVPEPAPRSRLRAVRHWARARRRTLLAALCGLLTVLVLTPPVRATVSDWFGFHGVQVRQDPSVVPSPGGRVPDCAAPVRLEEASRRAGFTPVVPEALGPPDAVSVGALPHGRSLVSLCWRGDDGRTVRLDQFPGRLDFSFTKTVREQPQWLDVGGQALWFPRPHVLTFWMTDAEGRRLTREERTAGPTLLWSPAGEITLRLEGVGSRARAHEIAASVDPSPSGV
ncbi:hypothetical protein ABT368_02505 [Streptomyces althioticus]|uniref:hypothetical protein n=1 Tax=Streptomyces althioticus TaxID=83380 RepID=UPI001874E87B|nr:hypothetical protein GCM10010250_33070 [Streptomyces althioticus]GGT31463.1 hypothetical protein GCM10010243_05090 [Streptomyces matensis]